MDKQAIIILGQFKTQVSLQIINVNLVTCRGRKPAGHHTGYVAWFTETSEFKGEILKSWEWPGDWDEGNTEVTLKEAKRVIDG